VYVVRLAVWLSGYDVGRINEVTLRGARLVLGWVTVLEYTVLIRNQLPGQLSLLPLAG